MVSRIGGSAFLFLVKPERLKHLTRRLLDRLCLRSSASSARLALLEVAEPAELARPPSSLPGLIEFEVSFRILHKNSNDPTEFHHSCTRTSLYPYQPRVYETRVLTCANPTLLL